MRPTGGQALSFAAVERVVNDVGRILTFNDGLDVVYLPVVPARLGAVAVFPSERERARSDWEGVVVHPVVEDMGFRPDPPVRPCVGFARGRGPTPRKGDAMVRRMMREFPTVEFWWAQTVPYEQMREWYGMLTVLVAPSMDNRETYNRAIPEAASAGVPVLSSDLRGPRLSGCAAEYLPPADDARWQERLSVWLAAGRNERQEARARFERNVVERQHAELAALRAFLMR